MKSLTLTLLLLISFLALSCQPSNKKLYDEVMQIHDDVMPKMDNLYTEKNRLTKKLEADSLMAPERKAELTDAINALEAASKGMMVWMRQFNPEADTTSVESQRKYLENEKVKIQQVKDDMLKALEKAGEF